MGRTHTTAPQGTAYSIFAAALWPSIPFTAPIGTEGLAYGFVTAVQVRQVRWKSPGSRGSVAAHRQSSYRPTVLARCVSSYFPAGAAQPTDLDELWAVNLRRPGRPARTLPELSADFVMPLRTAASRSSPSSYPKSTTTPTAATSLLSSWSSWRSRWSGW